MTGPCRLPIYSRALLQLIRERGSSSSDDRRQPETAGEGKHTYPVISEARGLKAVWPWQAEITFDIANLREGGGRERGKCKKHYAKRF